jgi:hypothetical protein
LKKNQLLQPSYYCYYCYRPGTGVAVEEQGAERIGVGAWRGTLAGAYIGLETMKVLRRCLLRMKKSGSD